MPNWPQLLDEIVARKAQLPPHVGILRIPLIDGWEPGRVWGTWKVDPDLISPQGSLFGGHIAAVSDEMLGMVTGSILGEGEGFTTSDIRVHYFRPVRGGELKIEASVLHRGRSSVHVEATFTGDDGELAAKAGATQIIRRAGGVEGR